MNYNGMLYAKIAGKYISLDRSAQEFDNLESENKMLKEAINEFKKMMAPGSFDVFKALDVLSKINTDSK